jgi:ribonuclease HI
LGAEQFYCILTTELAYLIWKIKCEHVLEQNDREQWHTTQEIKNRWHDVVNKRCTLDQAITTKIYEAKAIPIKVVLYCTWSGTLQNESSLPENCLNF